MSLKDAVIATAYSQIGYQEADNGGEYKYCPEMGWEPYSQWCGIFISWCFKQNGDPYGTSASAVPLLHYTPSAAAEFINRNAWYYDPQVGDCILFDWGGGGLGSSIGLIDHIGIVTNIDNWASEGYVTTVEGNITNGGNPAVGEFQRYRSVISGFGRPAWPADAPAKPKLVTGAWNKGPNIQLRWFTNNARNLEVGRLQDALIANGIPNIWPLNRFANDIRTQQAVKLYQKRQGWPQTGFLTANQFYKLGFTVVKPNNQVQPRTAPANVLPGVRPVHVQPGKSNGQVLIVRRALAKVGIKVGVANPAAGPEFVKAYAAWQRKLGYAGKDASGAPGIASLRALAKQTKSFIAVP